MLLIIIKICIQIPKKCTRFDFLFVLSFHPANLIYRSVQKYRSRNFTLLPEVTVPKQDKVLYIYRPFLLLQVAARSRPPSRTMKEIEEIIEPVSCQHFIWNRVFKSIQITISFITSQVAPITEPEVTVVSNIQPEPETIPHEPETTEEPIPEVSVEMSSIILCSISKLFSTNMVYGFFQL